MRKKVILAIMKSFWIKNSTFTFGVWVLGQVDHCDENFWIVKYSKQKYARILVLWLSNAIWLGGAWVPILVGNDLPMHDFPYSKGFVKFGCQEPSKIMLDFWIFSVLFLLQRCSHLLGLIPGWRPRPLAFFQVGITSCTSTLSLAMVSAK